MSTNTLSTRLISSLGMSLLAAACGTAKKANSNGGAGGPSATSNVIPSGFVSSAKSEADVASAFSSIAKPTIDSASSSLLLSVPASNGSGSLALLDGTDTQTATTTDTATDTATDTVTATATATDTSTASGGTSSSSAFGMPDFTSLFGILGKQHASGADCSDIVALLDSQFGALANAIAQQSSLGSIVTGGAAAGTASAAGTGTDGLGSLYTVQNVPVTDPRFGFDEKMTRNPSATSDPNSIASMLASVLPQSMEIEGGANGQQADLEASLTWSIAGGATGQSTGDQSSTVNMSFTYSVFADGAAQTLKYGTSGTLSSTGADASNMTFDGTSTLQGGASPSLNSTFDMTGTASGQALNAHVQFSLSKDADGDYDLSLNATNTGQAAVNETLKLQRSGSTCKVE